MTDTQEPTAEQQDELIVKALGLYGFEYSEFMGLHVKPHGDKQIVVDLKDGKHGIWFNVDKKAVRTDDNEGTLAKVADIMTDAMVGKMPTQSTPDMQYSKDTDSLSDDDPAKVPEHKSAPAHLSETPEPPAQPGHQNNMLDLIQKYVGNDVMQVFGDTGTGTKIATMKITDAGVEVVT